jgi:diguanylate cyclase (GGDEF)-like protein
MQDEKSSILVVDDENTDLDVINNILKSEYTVYVAKTGEMALRRAMSDHPDLILLDIMLPDMSGYEVLKRLKCYEATRMTPIIFITGLGTPADEERGFLLGAVDYITKPFNHSIVKARIRNHMKIVRQMRTVERLGTIDVLTELLNRRGFWEHLGAEGETAANAGKPISILCIDVDSFHQYNETYGHLQGDILLQTLAKTFARQTRQFVDLAARVGGDEFAVFMPGLDLAAAVEAAEALRQTVEVMEISSMGTMTTQATISIGVAAGVLQQGKDIFEVLAEADREMERAKREGNQVCSGSAEWSTAVAFGEGLMKLYENH